MLVLMLILLGCAAPTTAAVPSSAATLSPTSSAATPPREATAQDTPGRLVSLWTDSPPEIDGRVESVWEAADPLHVPLTWGMGGTEHALDVALRSLHTDQVLYLLAQWPGGAPVGPQDTVSNLFTLHWRIPDPAAQRLDCTVACHTASVDGGGRLAYANAETIPQGGGGALDAAGSWEAGTWTLEWSRPLVNGNPYDLQFEDPEAAYSFLVKVFERIEGRPDPISARHLLVFYP
jgi:hypothetical protein